MREYGCGFEVVHLREPLGQRIDLLLDEAQTVHARVEFDMYWVVLASGAVGGT